MLGRSELTLAGGAENYSRALYVVNGAHWGLKRGEKAMGDSLYYCLPGPL